MMILLEKVILWGSYLVFPFLFLLIFIGIKYKSKIFRIVVVVMLILSLIFIWARFVEPSMLIVRQTKIELGFEKKIVFIADHHLGIYKKAGFLNKTVNKINQIDPDIVLIGGDFVSDPDYDEIPELFKPLSAIKAPVYAVMGNHDDDNGEEVFTKVKQAVQENNINLIDNQVIEFDDFTLLGIGDRWADNDRVELLENFSDQDTLITLVHNPDSIPDFPNKYSDLTLTGHTHCGQIRIPFIYKYAIPTKGDYDKGLSEEDNTLLYITCGLGETGLPMRLFNPPVIDVLDIR